MMIRLSKSRKVVGTKQTLKYLEKNKVSVLYIAKDADSWIVDKVKILTLDHDVEIVEIETMKELGKMCNIDIKAAVAAIIKEV